jgi:hypothetical protein
MKKPRPDTKAFPKEPKSKFQSHKRRTKMTVKTLGRMPLAVVLAVGVWAAAGCEDYTIGGMLIDALKGDDSDKSSETQTETSTSSGSGQSNKTVSAKDVSGTWKGKAGTAQGSTTLRLKQSGTSLSGSWTWGAGDTRTCSGYRQGSTICLWDQKSTGDAWEMTLSEDGSKMSGRAQKYGGGSYALSFSR